MSRYQGGDVRGVDRWRRSGGVHNEETVRGLDPGIREPAPSRFRPGIPCLAAVLILALVSGTALGQDAVSIGVVKGVLHRQTGPGSVVLETNPYVFNSFVETAGPGRVTSASVIPAGRPTVPLSNDQDGWYYDAPFATQAALDAAFPNGSQAVLITGKNDGNRNLVVQLVGDTYPPVPTVQNFAALQAADPAQPLTIAWAPFTGGTLLDFVQVSIETDGPGEGDVVFESRPPGDLSALDGTDTSLTLPAGLLAPGRNYRARLLLARIVDFNISGYGQGVPAIAAYFRETTLPLVTSGSADLEPPYFWNAAPSDSDSPVPRNSGVSFQFNERMQANQSIDWTGLNPAKVSYRWSEDGRVLFCLYADPLPAGVRIEWRLNRDGFRDVAGNAMPWNQEGGFTTSTTDPSGLSDIAVTGIYRGEFYTQEPGSAPKMPPQGGHYAGAFAESIGFNTMLSASVRTPGGESQPLEYDSGEEFGIEIEGDTASALDAALPMGEYQLSIETAHGGTRAVTLNLPAKVYPSIPEFLNPAALQAIDPAQPVTLSWKPMAGGLASDIISVWIEPMNGGSEVFQTPDFKSAQALNGLATSVVIPPGTFSPGREYYVELEFIHPAVVNTTAIPGATAVVAFVRSTGLRIQTTGTPLGSELSIEPTGDGRMQLRVTGDPGVQYVLEGADSLGAGWQTLANFQIQGGAFAWTDDQVREQRYYRVREE